MSASEAPPGGKEQGKGATFAELASELSALCADAIDNGTLDAIPNDSLGQIFASVVRLYAAKAQEDGPAPRPFGRNSGVTPTDVAIGCTALLDGVGLQVFELGAWQTMSNVARFKYETTGPAGQEGKAP
jgi:hypothetical protein